MEDNRLKNHESEEQIEILRREFSEKAKNT